MSKTANEEDGSGENSPYSLKKYIKAIDDVGAAQLPHIVSIYSAILFHYTRMLQAYC